MLFINEHFKKRRRSRLYRERAFADPSSGHRGDRRRRAAEILAFSVRWSTTSSHWQGTGRSTRSRAAFAETAWSRERAVTSLSAAMQQFQS